MGAVFLAVTETFRKKGCSNCNKNCAFGFEIPSLPDGGGTGMISTLFSKILRLLEVIPENAVEFCNNETHFHSWGYITKQNMRYRSVANSCELHERPLHSFEVTVYDFS